MDGRRVESVVGEIESELKRLCAREALARWRWMTCLDERRKAEYLQAKGRRWAYLSQNELLHEIERAQSAAGPVDPLVRRQAEVLHRSVLLHQLPGERAARLAELEVEIEEIRARLPAEPLWAGKEPWRLPPGPEALEVAAEAAHCAAPLVVELVRLRNEGARSLGYPDFFAMALALDGIDEEALFAGLSRIEAKTGPAAYPGEEDPKLASGLDELAARPDLTVRIMRYFDAVGLSTGGILAQSDLEERPGKARRADCIDVDRAGDVRLAAALSPGLEGARTLLGELGRAVYRLNIALELPYALRVPAHRLAEIATSVLFERLIYDERWLCEWLEPRWTRDSPLPERLRDTARASRLAALRQGLLFTHFERELYRDPGQDLDGLWRGLAARYLGAEPPHWPPGQWAVAEEFGETEPVSFSGLLGEMVSAALAAAIEEELGEGALAVSPAAGYLLIDKLFMHGARHPWQKLLSAACGRALNLRAGLPDALFAYSDSMTS